MVRPFAVRVDSVSDVTVCASAEKPCCVCRLSMSTYVHCKYIGRHACNTNDSMKIVHAVRCAPGCFQCSLERRRHRLRCLTTILIDSSYHTNFDSPTHILFMLSTTGRRRSSATSLHANPIYLFRCSRVPTRLPSLPLAFFHTHAFSFSLPFPSLYRTYFFASIHVHTFLVVLLIDLIPRSCTPLFAHSRHPILIPGSTSHRDNVASLRRRMRSSSPESYMYDSFVLFPYLPVSPRLFTLSSPSFDSSLSSLVWLP